MSKWALLLLVAVGATAAAQTSVPIDQFEQVLSGLHRLPDGAAAAQLAHFELTERVSSVRLARWQAGFTGMQTKAVLLAHADASAFLPLPISEIPALPAPDRASQAEMLARASEYIRTMRPLLPNFSAVRTATQFEISTPAQMMAEERMLQFMQLTNARLGFRSLGSVDSSGKHLFLVGTTDGLVTYRNGAEVQSHDLPRRKQRRLFPGGLTSSGEFGPILSLVDDDAAHGNIAWDHWEMGPAGTLAVFRYAVPKEASHFGVSTRNGAFGGLPAGEDHPAYHGQIAIDPADGTIFRIVIQSDEEEAASLDAAGIVVEYASVTIGSKNYVCPVLGVALSTAAGSATGGPMRTFLNHVTFTEYHVFRSESRIVPDADQ